MSHRETMTRREEQMERDQLAEYVLALEQRLLDLGREAERLKAEAAFAPDRVLQAVKEGERARIRGRLLEAWPDGTAVPWTDRDQDWLVVVEAICPREPSDG